MMELFRTLSVIVVICTSFKVVRAQSNPQCARMNRGRSFVITFPGNYEGGDKDIIELSILIAPSGVINGTSVSLSSDFNSFKSTFEIGPMGFSWFPIPSEFALSMESERSSKVIQVVAESEVIVFGLIYQRFSTRAISGIPTDNLEDNYVQMDFEEPNDSPSLFAVVGVEENYTQVVVNLTNTVTFEGQIYPAGSAIEFSVAQNEVVQIVADSDGGFIEGIDVESDRPIVVLSGYTCSSSQGSPCENVGEEDFAAISQGANYLYDTPSSEDNSIFAIQAYYRDTVVNVPGLDPVTLQPGESFVSEVIDIETISTSQPVSVVQYVIAQDSSDPPVRILSGCSLVSCPVLDLSLNTAVAGSGNSPGSTLRFSCDEGYTLVGSSEVRCDESGVWSPEIPQCTREYLFESWVVGIIIACCAGTLIAVSLVFRGLMKQKRETGGYYLGQAE